MKKFVVSVVAAGITSIVLLAAPQAEAGDPKPCVRTDFKTVAIAEACKKGGQKAAKKAMKKFTKAAKAKQSGLNCKSCHSNLRPKYELKSDGLELYKKLGGK